MRSDYLTVNGRQYIPHTFAMAIGTKDLRSQAGQLRLPSQEGTYSVRLSVDGRDPGSGLLPHAQVRPRRPRRRALRRRAAPRPRASPNKKEGPDGSGPSRSGAGLGCYFAAAFFLFTARARRDLLRAAALAGMYLRRAALSISDSAAL